MAVMAVDLLAAFRQKGMKITPQRRLLCSLVVNAHDHPTVETLHLRALKEMPTISLKTVYTTLTELAELGLIRLVALGTGSIRVDPDPTPHAHYVCRGCGSIVDQPLEPDAVASPSLAEDLGFIVEERDVIFRGRCASCLAQDAGITREGDVGGDAQYR